MLVSFHGYLRTPLFQTPVCYKYISQRNSLSSSDHTMTTTTNVLAGCILLCLSTLFLSTRGPKLRLPPGPTGLPLIGNLLQLSPTSWKDVFPQWARTYGRKRFDSCFITTSPYHHHRTTHLLHRWSNKSSRLEYAQGRSRLTG